MELGKFLEVQVAYQKLTVVRKIRKPVSTNIVQTVHWIQPGRNLFSSQTSWKAAKGGNV